MSETKVEPSSAESQAKPSRRSPGSPRQIGPALISLGLLASAGALGYFFGYLPYERSRPSHQFRKVALPAIAAGDMDTVHRVALRLSEERGYEPQYHLLYGLVKLKKAESEGDIRDALREFQLATDDSDTRLLALKHGGECMLRLKRYAEAEKMLNDALQDTPADPDARRTLAAVYYDLGALDQAIKQLALLADYAPDDWKANRMLGLIFKNRENYGPALTSYRESLVRLRRALAARKVTPANKPRSKNDFSENDRRIEEESKDEILSELAECCMQEQQLDEALEALKEAPETADNLILKAQCLYKVKGSANDEVKELIDKALELSEDHVGGLLWKGKIAIDEKDGDTAITALVRASLVDPKSRDVRYALGQAYQLVGDKENAEREMAEADRLKTLIQRQGELNSEVVANPANPDMHYELGEICEQLGQYASAQAEYQLTLLYAPDHTKAAESIQRVTQKLQAPSSPAGILTPSAE